MKEEILNYYMGILWWAYMQGTQGVGPMSALVFFIAMALAHPKMGTLKEPYI